MDARITIANETTHYAEDEWVKAINNYGPDTMFLDANLNVVIAISDQGRHKPVCLRAGHPADRETIAWPIHAAPAGSKITLTQD